MAPPARTGLAALPQAASLLALLRAGEQSAAVAFERIARRLSPGQLSLAAPPLTRLIADEHRHDAMLAAHAELLPAAETGGAATRRFFRRLESREPGVHLARVAALDSCVCQVLSRVLAAPVDDLLPESLIASLQAIRRDEGRHVRETRKLALEFDVDLRRFGEIGAEVRAGFATILAQRALTFDALGVDAADLVARVRRDS